MVALSRSLARRIERKQQSLQKAGMSGNIQALSEALKALPPPEERRAFTKALEDVSNVTTAVSYLVSDLHQLIYELDKQKMVNLRIIRTATEETPSFLVGGGSTKKHYTGVELIALTAQYEAEYDAIYALSLLAPQAG
jgi:hypothetical protein